MSHDDIRAALEAASTPWESIPALLDDERRVVRKDGGGDLAQGCSCDYATMSAADAHLIAHAPEWLAELLAENERLTDDLDRLRLSDDYAPEGVDIVMAKLRDHKRRAESAEQWKTEALPVIDGLQELGAALGIPLGKRITGPDALAAVKALTARAEAAEQANQMVRKFIDERPQYITAMKNTPSDGDMTDYYRWSGGAEARRQLATALGLTVPHNPGERALDGGER